MSENTSEPRPVLILEPDNEAALTRQGDLRDYGINWIAIVHDAASAEQFLASDPAAAVLLSGGNANPSVLELARALRRGGTPCLIFAPPTELATLSRLADLPTPIARDCNRGALFEALDGLGLSNRRRSAAPPATKTPRKND